LIKSQTEQRKDIDSRIAKITEKYHCSKKIEKKSLILKSRNILWETLVDLLATMIVGMILGHVLDRKFSSGKWCFTLCMILSCFACVKKIMNIR
jgi:F0F1-type ATP synthase assembly protein I